MESLRKAKEEELKAKHEQERAAEIVAQKEAELRKANEELQLQQEIEMLELRRKQIEELRNKPKPTAEEIAEQQRKAAICDEIEILSNRYSMAELDVLKKNAEYLKAVNTAEELKNNIEELKAQLQ